MTEDTARPIYASKHASQVVSRMVDTLELWATPTDAALFLASLAVNEDLEPVPDEDIGERVEVGDLSNAVQGLDAVGELALFEVVRGPDESLGEVVDRDLPGLVEAGADLLGPKLKGASPDEAVAELVGLVEA